MKIVSAKIVDMGSFRKKTAGKVYSIHVKIENHDQRAKEIIDEIINTSWLAKLDPVDARAFSATSKRTIKKLVSEILSNVTSPISSELGEYLVSATAKKALEVGFNHKGLPLAELLKEKVTGNPGFDFHTETTDNLINFGEAKYSSNGNPHGEALGQISDFILLEKDSAELLILKPLVSAKAIDNHLNGEKAFAAAFSIIGKNGDLIIRNALMSSKIDPLLDFPEVFVIGVEI